VTDATFRQVTSTRLTQYGQKLRKLSAAGIQFTERRDNNHTLVFVSAEDFERADQICCSVRSRFPKANRGWRNA
jgi:hypothetical protein